MVRYSERKNNPEKKHIPFTYISYAYTQCVCNIANNVKNYYSNKLIQPHMWCRYSGGRFNGFKHILFNSVVN